MAATSSRTAAAAISHFAKRTSASRLDARCGSWSRRAADSCCPFQVPTDDSIDRIHATNTYALSVYRRAVGARDLHRCANVASRIHALWHGELRAIEQSGRPTDLYG